MIKKTLKGLVLILALLGCSGQDKVQKIDYQGAFKKDNSIYFKLKIEGIGIRYLIDHGSNHYNPEKTQRYMGYIPKKIS